MSILLNAYLRASLTGGLLTVLILILRLIVGQRAGLLWRQAAYALLLLHLILPLNFASPLSLYSAAPESVLTATREAPAFRAPLLGNQTIPSREPLPDEALPPVSGDAGYEADTPSVTWLLPMIWLLGAGLYLSGRVFASLRCRRHIKPYRAHDDRPPSLLEQARREMGLRKTPELMTSPLGMAAQGVLRPRILVADAAAIPDETLLMALRHECAHIRRRDVARLRLLTLVTALHWWNPLVYLLTRAVRRDIELACDADVLRHLDRYGAIVYGRAIIAMSAVPPAPLHPALTDSSIKERIAMIKKPMRKRVLLSLLTTACCAVLAVSVLTSPVARGADTRYGRLVPWEEACALWEPGEVTTILDIETQTEFQALRRAIKGTGKADAQPVIVIESSDGSQSEARINPASTMAQILPASAEDERVLKHLFGGDWIDSADSRETASYRPVAVWLGDEWVAASINGAACLDDAGNLLHLSVHFEGSLRWTGGEAGLVYAVDEGHAAAIRLAAGK